MGKFFYLGRQEDKGGRGRSDFVNNDPDIAHDLFQGRTEGNGISLAQGLDLNGELAGCVLTIGNDVDATGVPRRGHDVPPEQRELVAAVVEAGIAGELRIKRHVVRPNGRVQPRRVAASAATCC